MREAFERSRANLSSFQSSFSVENEDEELADSTPLQTRILQIVKSSPNYTIRPARLSHELGISIADASAELCGLLAAVGEGSSFHFEDVGDDNHLQQEEDKANIVKTMVFQFPKDFEQRAHWKQRREDWKKNLIDFAKVLLRALKVFTAFGLIISLLIVSVAAMLALMAAIVALSRGDTRGGHRNSILTRQLRNLCITVRQLLWFYAVFGPMDRTSDGYYDPYLRETAYDIWLVLSLCCGHPGSIFFWFRASQLQRRRRRGLRGWGRSNGNNSFGDYDSGVEGVTLLRRGEPISSNTEASDGEYRGLLSVAAEFLFGHSGTPNDLVSETDRWKLRAAVIVHKSTMRFSKIDEQQTGGDSTAKELGVAAVSLEELSPYVDNPPASLDDTVGVVSEGLSIVSHFNGVPNSSRGEKSMDAPTKALFAFPELLAESQISTRYEDLQSSSIDDGSWESLFYTKDPLPFTPTPSAGRRLKTAVGDELPSYLQETRHVFSKLQPKQFFSCLVLGVLNFLGVLWFAQSVQPGGVLSAYLPSDGSDLVLVRILHALISVLQFYSKLFFFIPAIRLLWIVACNEQIKCRNQRRKDLSASLSE